jgi:hypothetical protein
MGAKSTGSQQDSRRKTSAGLAREALTADRIEAADIR